MRSRRQRGGALARVLVFLLGPSVGWIGSTTVNAQAAVSPAPGTGAESPARSGTAATVGSATNGALVIPVRDSGGQPRGPMILLPVQARSLPPASGISAAGIIQPLPRPAGTNRIATNQVSKPRPTSDRIVECQVTLVLAGISPGSIDGLMGSQTRSALRAFQQREGLPVTGNLDEPTLERLVPDRPLHTNHIVTSEDLERLIPLGSTWLEKSQQPRLDFESVLELVAEKTCTHPNLVRRLNPSIDWTNLTAGTELKVLAVQYPEPVEKASSIRIRLGERTLQVFGASSNLLAHFPCSIARRVEKRPIGEELHVAVLAPDPNYTFDPAVFPESAEARELGRKLILQPGPNNPVGTVWIGLDKTGYGIHGTPKPEEVGRTESHGCFRLANWNARHLLQLVTIGTPVEVLP